MTLQQLGAYRPLGLYGVDGSADVRFGLRADETVASALLNLSFNLSPALLPELSHVNIFLNDQIVRVIRIDKEHPGTTMKLAVPLDPSLFLPYNQLRFQLIGHYTHDCETPRHTSLWAMVSNVASTLELQLQKTRLKDDLALLPLPFFDAHENEPLKLQFVLPEGSSHGMLKPAGVVANWFGKLASYRGAQFNTHLGELPAAAHAVVFLTNNLRPPALAHLPKVSMPTLQMVEHPSSPGHKLLLVMGQDEAQLKTAADALALKHTGMSGPSMKVTSLKEPPLREAYDAPGWASIRRPLRLAELVNNPQELQLRGTPLNQAISMRLRLPPDLFTWRQPGVPVHVKYHYTPNQWSAHGTLNVSVNDQFFKSQPLLSAEAASKFKLSSLLGSGTVEEVADFRMPGFLVGQHNLFQLAFHIPVEDQGRCRSMQSPELRVAVDPDSSIDLTAFSHYLAMPNLAAYANSGYPFSRYADLAQTGILMADKPSRAEITTLLTVLGHLGASTGLAATRFELTGPAGLDTLQDRDLLILGRADPGGILKQWGQDVPVLLGAQDRALQPTSAVSGLFWQFLRTLLPGSAPQAPNGSAELKGQGEIGVLSGFESPLKSGRSVVTFTASDDATLELMSAALTDPAKVSKLQGGVAIFRGQDIESFQTEKTYYLGNLWWGGRIWYHLHHHPIILGVLGLMIGLLLALLVYLGLRALAKRRLETHVG